MRCSKLWRLLAALLLLAGVACAPAIQPLPQVALPSPTPASPISFPRDAAPHDALMEWWYYTGHLSDAAGNAYGFEFVIFQVTRANQPSGYLAHFAISDVSAQRFSHQAQVAQTPAPATAFPLDVSGWSLDQHDGGDTITAAMHSAAGAEAAYSLQLQLEDGAKPPAPHNGGYIAYPPDGGSYYYSRTRLSATGTLGLPDGSSASVSGIAWMDHQWGNFVIPSRGGWDWYSLQLDDNTELMLYVLRDADNAATAVYGTAVAADGSASQLPAGTVTAEATGSWTSSHTGAVYPSGWHLQLPDGRRLVLTPQLQDQELYFPGAPTGTLAYWEGSVAITGDATGLGYVELTGYAGR